jgi:GT2 family glycosyltransferase
LEKTPDKEARLSPLSFPPISVVISTRNRGASIIAPVKSILSNNYPDFEVVVLDQSETGLTREALQPFMANPNFNYIHSSSRGLGIGHNLAVKQARNELIAITDDDCEVPPDWLERLAEAFSSDSRIGLVFGNVLASEYDILTGYIPVFERNQPRLLTSINDDLYQGLGIGACLGIKRSAWQSVEGFDEMLGPGSPFGSLEDRDMGIRLLLAGYYVYQTPTFSVIHSGFRNNEQLPVLAFQDWFGFGSCYAKYLKCGFFNLTDYFLIKMWFHRALLPSLRKLIKYHRIGSITPIFSFWVGFFISLLTPLDRTNSKFMNKKSIALNISRLLNNLISD